MKRHLSPAEVLGIVAIAVVVFCAWLYSILLEFQFFVSVTPINNPIFPYLGLAFTGIGFALWGIGFLCARKPFTQVITMIMGLASGGTAFTIAYMEFTASGDKRYGITADPTTYKNALLTVGIMFVLNLITLALKAIVWRFSQHGTGFFQPYNPDAQYLPTPTQQPRYVEEERQPKEERSFEQRATVRQLPPARSQGTGFMSRLRNGLDAFKQPVTVQFEQQNEEAHEEDEHDRDVRAINEAFEKKLDGVTCANGCGASHVQANWCQFPGDDETTWYCPSCFAQLRQSKTPEQPQPLTVDRKAEVERAAKQQKQPKK